MMNRPKKFLHKIFEPFKFNSGKEGQDDEDLEKIAAQEQKLFPYQVLVSATKDFHPNHKLGEGGFGPVYKGKLNDGRQIAVKRLSHTSNQGKKEFMNEAKLLSRVQHRNVVNLFGYCVHGAAEKLLVYEYVANESLDKLLFKSNSEREVLDWKRRFDIMVGVARGLLYLHEGSHNCIVHRDIKSSNILLDEKWVPKIADFGMARLFPEEQTHVNTRVAGTNGYMAPEYVMHGNLSVKADVFSFGVVVLELISGQKNSTFNFQADAQNLLDWVPQLFDTVIPLPLTMCPRNGTYTNPSHATNAPLKAYKLYKKGRSLEIMDSALASSAAPDQVEICIQIGLLCTQSDPRLRPNMQRVVVMLSKKPGNLEEPMRPGLPGSRYRRSRRPAVLSTAGTSGTSASHTFDSSLNSTYSTSATATPSGVSVPNLDPHGKRPIQE